MERRIDRLEKYMIIKKLNDNQVTKDCDLSVGLLNQAKRGKSDLGSKAIDKILSKYQDLSRVWLLTGEGSMLSQPGSRCRSHGCEWRRREGVPGNNQKATGEHFKTCGYCKLADKDNRQAVKSVIILEYIKTWRK